MRFSSMVVGGLIATGMLGAPAMAAMPKLTAQPERSGLVVAARAQRMTLQQIAQIPRPRAPHRMVYSSKPELR